jgi:hypothetical protein
LKPLQSTIENKEEAFDSVRNYLHGYEFTLGGNWDYEHGSFDRHLDEAHKVWLRIPFQVTQGVLDGDTDDTDAMIQIGTPFVLKHVYNEGLDKEAHVHASAGSLIDQFQEPVDKDAPVEEQWVSKAERLLKEVEQNWLQ